MNVREATESIWGLMNAVYDSVEALYGSQALGRPGSMHAVMAPSLSRDIDLLQSVAMSAGRREIAQDAMKMTGCAERIIRAGEELCRLADEHRNANRENMRGNEAQPQDADQPAVSPLVTHTDYQRTLSQSSEAMSEMLYSIEAALARAVSLIEELEMDRPSQRIAYLERRITTLKNILADGPSAAFRWNEIPDELEGNPAN